MMTLKRVNSLFIATNQYGEVCAFTLLARAIVFLQL